MPTREHPYKWLVRTIEAKSIGLNQTLSDALADNEIKLYLFTLAKETNISFIGKCTGATPIRPHMDRLGSNGQFIEKDTYVSIDHTKDGNSSPDAFLWLYDANGMLVQSDDDGGGNRNAKIMR